MVSQLKPIDRSEPRVREVGPRWGGLSADELKQAYEVALETRAQIVTCMMMKTRGEGVEFWIGLLGEESTARRWRWRCTACCAWARTRPISGCSCTIAATRWRR